MITNACWPCPRRYPSNPASELLDSRQDAICSSPADSQFTILFLSTSPSSPFVTHQTLSTSPVNLSSPDPNRSWLTLNHGRLFDPSLIVYERIAKLSLSSEGFSNTTIEMVPTEPTSLWSRFPILKNWIPPPAREVIEEKETKVEEEAPLPPGWIDLRYRGVGVVLDLSWRRSEEELQWELSDWERSTERQRKDRQTKRSGSQAGEMTRKAKGKDEGPVWRRMSFLGSW